MMARLYHDGLADNVERFSIPAITCIDPTV
jgi:hypothetical protein